MAHMRMYWKRAGAHVIVRVFTADTAAATHGKNGDLVFSMAEWVQWLPAFAQMADVIEDGAPVGATLAAAHGGPPIVIEGMPDESL